MTIIEDIYINDEELAVVLEGSPTIENDSFDHEFGTETYPDYYIVENVEYDKSLYTAEQNRLIEEHISKNYNYICEKIINEFKNELI